MTVMRLVGAPDGSMTPFDGQYLKDFDFAAYDGRGLITMTPNVEEAKVFADLSEAMVFYLTSPECKPLRDDGKPNRPLTATNWEFLHG